jgi:hypothetical protein
MFREHQPSYTTVMLESLFGGKRGMQLTLLRRRDAVITYTAAYDPNARVLTPRFGHPSPRVQPYRADIGTATTWLSLRELNEKKLVELGTISRSPGEDRLYEVALPRKVKCELRQVSASWVVVESLDGTTAKDLGMDNYQPSSPTTLRFTPVELALVPFSGEHWVDDWVVWHWHTD